ncbi:MAG: FliH/SctL family protein [Planctomycetota bacterium]|nr:FliH/SctL family protein [Planctomycetota bacterium]
MPGILRDQHENQRQLAEYQFSDMVRTGDATVPAYSDRRPDQPLPSLPHAAASPDLSVATGLAGRHQNTAAQGQEDRRTATAALHALVEQIEKAHQQWRVQAETEVTQLAFALAERIVRRQLDRETDIPLDLVREAVDLAGRGKRLRIALHPTDHRVHQDEIRRLTATLHATAEVEIVGDQNVERGGCVVETPDGRIDQTASAQLQRIREELQA